VTTIDREGTAKRADARFRPLFERWARRVRARLALRYALTGAAVGLAFAVVAAAAAWKTRHGALRAYAAGAGAVGAIAGLAWARRRRWSDGDVALYLDQRLDSEEAIATAAGLRAPDDRRGRREGGEGRRGDERDKRDKRDSSAGDPARAVVLATATTALKDAGGKRVHPKVLKPAHALVPLAAAGLVFIARAPLPPAPIAAAAPGTTRVQTADVAGLEKAIRLAQASARDAAQRDRLDAIAKDAEKLKADLREGMEKREAQDRIARLKDAIAEERLSLGADEKRADLESSVSKLEESDLTRKAGEALGDHDLQSLDEEMERIANAREKADRELARKKIDEAAELAKKQGAGDVAKALEDEKGSMDKRSARADALRELADGMKGAGVGGGEVQAESEALDRKKSDAAARKLAEEMAKALEKLTPEERKRLAEKLREMAKKNGVEASDADTMKDLADDLGTPDGEKRLEDQLRDLAKEDDETDESKRQGSLDDAEEGAEGTERGMRRPGEGQPGQGQNGEGQPGQGQPGQPGQGEGQQGQGQEGQQGQGRGQGQGQTAIPIPGSGQGRSQSGSNGGRSSGGTGGAGGGHDEGSGDHRGSTPLVDAHGLKSRAHGALNKAQGMPGSTTTYVPGRAGGTANARGTGDLHVVGPREVEGVEQSDVPEEYREQVRQYFQP